MKIIIHICYGVVNNVVCWRPVLKTVPVCVFVLLRGVEKEAQTQSGLGKIENQLFGVDQNLTPKLSHSFGPAPVMSDCIILGEIGRLSLGIK